MKIEVSAVAEILKKHKVEPVTFREIVEEMNFVTQPDAGDDLAPPAPKKQFVVLLSDPAGTLPKVDLVAWVVQIPEDGSPFSTPDRIFKGAYDFNASKRGRLLPVKSVGEAIESASAKYFKDAELWIKTKLPVAVIVTDNVLPRDEFKVERVDRRRRDDEVPGVKGTVALAARLDGDEKTEVYQRDGKFYVETTIGGIPCAKSCFATEEAAKEFFHAGAGE